MANWDKKGATKDGPLLPASSGIMSAVAVPRVAAAAAPCRAPEATGEGAVFIFDTGRAGDVYLAIVW